ncbi:DUF4469 domain-containing protein [Aliifodinibius sp. S!AR15-10]|uniref:DUF4469 domain-containing protein n=1 Tax=Aliifodinibius sp. S!AR15-10 TaxID=2950437 RepID=UPI0028652725|nr:DUF4469 domain-containing protein [Aliifodinibius sp. S!AR15-10]MDR8394393.1 DUF4469 domain-containing protein [Aliifodinibius sp. S!AR15-10]
MLNYSLYDNHFTEDDPDDRLARPVDVAGNSRDDLIEAITGPGSILKPTETEAVINNYWATIADYVRRGETYKDDHISIHFGISGTFTGDDDRFDPNRHSLIVSARLKDAITGAAEEVELRKVDSDRVAPEIETVYDWGSETNDDILTPGDVLELSGTHLKIHDNLEEEGVFFVSQSDDSEAKAEQIRTNEPKTLTMRIPESLAAGPYRIEVRNTHHDSDTLRTGIFKPVLTVE